MANKADLVDDDDREKGYGKYKNTKQAYQRSNIKSSNNFPQKDHGYFSDPERESGFPFEQNQMHYQPGPMTPINRVQSATRHYIVNTRSSKKKPIRTIKIERSQSPYKNQNLNRSNYNNSRVFKDNEDSIAHNSRVHTNNSRVYYEGGYGDESDQSDEMPRRGNNYYQSNVDTQKRVSQTY